METIKSFIWEYRFVLVIAAALGSYAFAEWNGFKAKSYALMLQAKSLAKDAVLKSGDEQVEWVIKKSYQILPKRWTILISEELMRKVVFFLYHKAKDYLDDGEINNSN
ncbi:hypothetical protein M2651_09510 [Clostridium sp. SYSU_GA19001]|uniref:hypothetical protein n=1 Tax=Clostridium caldaquaticum TaxID=2940653 RepID=UPI002076FCA1|nr:hypothetical protein [Clostridium caldaquaticum]MCM8711266.1 hypothetical protein [Clostridium caldaquaticum]